MHGQVDAVMEPAGRRHIYQFEAYRVDPARRELWCDDELVPIQPKAFDCLVYLIEHRDRVVGRDELIATVWGKVDIADNVLGQIISRIRSVLGDNAARQTTIRTAPRVGYRWVQPIRLLIDEVDTLPGEDDEVISSVEPAEVVVPDTPAPLAPEFGPEPSSATLSEETKAPVRPFAKYRYVAVAMVMVLLIALVIAMLTKPPAQQPARTAADSAVVLPVKLVSEAENTWIRLGIMDLINERLRTAGQTVVPSDNVVALARDMPVDPEPAQIAELAIAASAARVFQVTAKHSGSGWRVEIASVHGQGPRLRAHGDAMNVVDAARLASDNMAILLGLSILPEEAQETANTPRDILRQKVRAAMLVDRLDEARTLLERSGFTDDPSIMELRGDLETRAGNDETAQRIFEHMLERTTTQEMAELHASALIGLGFSLIRQLRYQDAKPHVNNAVALLESRSFLPGDSRGLLGFAYSARATLHRIDRRYAEAEADYIRARVLFESIDDHLAAARLDSNIFMLLQDTGRNAEAWALALAALAQMQVFGDVQAELRLRIALTQFHRSNLDIPAALAQVDEFDRLLGQINNPDLEEVANLFKVGILAESGLLTQAWDLMEVLLRNGDAHDHHISKGIWPEYTAAWLAHDTGKMDSARMFASKGLQEQASKPIFASDNIAHTWWVLHRAQYALEDDAAAELTFRQAQAWADTEGQTHQGKKNWMLMMAAEHAVYQNRPEEARALYEQAWGEALEWAVPEATLVLAESYCRFLFASGDLQRATLIAGQTARWTQTSYRAALLQTWLHHALGQTNAWRRALEQAQLLAGERQIPPELLEPPTSP